MRSKEKNGFNFKKTGFIFRQDLETRRGTFKLCYKIIENFLYQGHKYCLCSDYPGLPTKVDCLTRSRNVCCICSFGQRFDTGMLHEIKHDGVKLKQMLSNIFKVCTEAIKLGCTRFWDQDIYYSATNVDKVKTVICAADDDFDFLFNL